MNSTHELATLIIDALDETDDLSPSRDYQRCVALAERVLRDHYARRLRATRDAKRLTGERVEGQKPYGTHEHEKPVIQLMHELRANGQSFDAIASELNAKGFITRHQRRWHASTVSKILSANLGDNTTLIPH